MKKILAYLLIAAQSLTLACAAYAAEAAEPAVYEFETYETNDGKRRESSQASGGGYIQVLERKKTDTYSVTVPVTVAAGEYTLEFAASEATANSSNSAGPMFFKIDSGNEIEVNSTTCYISAITPTYPNEVFVMSKITYKTAVTLTEGNHNITVTLKQNSDTGITKGALDYMTLTKKESGTTGGAAKFTDGYLRLEAEDVAPAAAVRTKDLVSGGKIYETNWNKNDEENTLTFTFECEEADGEYMMYFASHDISLTYYSSIYFTLNDGDEVQLLTSNSTTVKALSYKSSMDVGTLTQYKYQTSLPLKKGTNTIKLRIPKRTSGDFIVAMVDYIDLLKVKNITALSATEVTAKRGESIALPLVNQDGEKIIAMDLDSYEAEFENSYIGEFADDTIYARNYGRTNLNITAVKDGKTYTVTAPVEVISETGLCVTSSSRNAGEASVTVKAAEKYTGGCKMIITVQNKENDSVTSVVDVYEENLSALAKGAEAKVSHTFTGLTENSIVSAFIVNTNGSAVYGKIAL